MNTGIDRRSLAEHIKDALIQQITAGDLAPGDRLVELKIAEEMQTSQAPVREALRALDALGLIEMRRNRGAVVREIDPAELREIYVVRAELEGLAVTLAITETPDLSAELLELCDKMQDALEGKDRQGFVTLNDQFHRAIVEASGNAVLVDVWAKLDVRTRTAVNIARNARPLEDALDDHRAIARAIQIGDAGDARAKLSGHIRSVVE